MPFWTVIFLAARIRIPRDIYDAAEVDGATGSRRFVHVTFPLLANLYLICTLLSTLWTLGDFTTVYLVSGGGPVPPKYWRLSASTTPSTPQSRRSALQR
jgi:multiple sugar transport system permease protein